MAAFLAFANKVPFYGAVVVCLDDPNLQRMIPRMMDKRVVTYGLEAGADVTARRGKIHGMEPTAKGTLIHAQAPHAESFAKVIAELR